MATHPGAGRELIDELMKTRREAHRLLISLRFQRRDKDADHVEAALRELTNRIDTLLADAMTTWEEKAKHLTERFANINQMLKEDVDQIRRRAANDKRIASAIGH